MAEWTTISLSKISTYRLDAEYYKAEQLYNDTILKKCNTEKLFCLANVNGGKRLPKGESFSKLPDSNVMFICTFDPFGEGKGIYTFREKCEEDTQIGLNDGTTKVFFNCTYQGDDLPEDIKKFYKYIRTGESESALTERIDKAVVRCRRNEIWRTEYMKELVVIQEAKEEGREEERQNNIEKLAFHYVSENKELTMEKAREMAKAILM